MEKDILTYQKFIEEVYDNNKSYREGKFIIEPTEYINSHGYFIVEDKYGAGKIRADHLLHGSTPSIVGALDKTQYYINKAHEVHGDKYDYSNVVYIGGYTDIHILCPIHGSFLQQPSKHLRGQGCRICGYRRNTEAQIKSVDKFIEEANLIHNFKYDYSLVDYKGNKKKVSIICKEHGIYPQTPHSHLRGSGCRECGRLLNGWSRSKWVQSGKGCVGIFYILKCWGDEEEFYKVGITHQSLRKRYNNIKKMPYTFEIIKEIMDFDKSRIWNLEKAFIKNLKGYHYTPLIPFKGSITECFSQVPDELLKNIK